MLSPSSPPSPFFALGGFSGAPPAGTRLSTDAGAPVGAADPSARSVEKFRRDYAPLPWVVEDVKLHFGLFDGAQPQDRATVVTARLQLRASDEALARHRSSGGTDSLPDLALDCEDLAVESVSINGAAVGAWTLAHDKLTVPTSSVPPAAWAAGEAFTVSTVVRLAPEANQQLSGLYKSSGMFCTQVAYTSPVTVAPLCASSDKSLF